MRQRGQSERSLLAAFVRSRRAAVAVEFALLCLIFLGIVGAILGTGIMYFFQSALEKSVRDTARLIRTGQAQGNSMTLTQVKSAICNGINDFSNCSTKLYVNVDTASSFQGASSTLPITNGVLNGSSTFNMGNSGSIVVMQVYLPWTPFLNFYGYANVKLANGDTLLGSTVAFRNEPY